MSSPTRRSVLASLAIVCCGGCVTRGSGSSGGIGTQPSPTSPTATDSPSSGGITPGTNVPDPDHSVYLANQGSERRTVHIQVERLSTGDTVFETTRDVEPGAEFEVYNLERADPDGVEAFVVCGRMVGPVTQTRATSRSGTPGDGAADCATVETSQCYGSIHVTARSDAVDVIYAVC